MQPRGVKLALGDVIRMKKPHPCGENRWEVIRTGMDIRLRCLGCGRLVLLPRKQVERDLREVFPGGAPPGGAF